MEPIVRPQLSQRKRGSKKLHVRGRHEILVCVQFVKRLAGLPIDDQQPPLAFARRLRRSPSPSHTQTSLLAQRRPAPFLLLANYVPGKYSRTSKNASLGSMCGGRRSEVQVGAPQVAPRNFGTWNQIAQKSQ